MKPTILSRTGNAFKVMFKNSEDYYLFTVGLSGTLCRLWGLQTEQDRLRAATRLAQIIAEQSSTAPESDEEYYLFTSENTEATLEGTLGRPDLLVFYTPNT